MHAQRLDLHRLARCWHTLVVQWTDNVSGRQRWGIWGCLGNGGIKDKTKRIKWFSRDYAGASQKATDTHK